jgi:hypothetical protein
MRVTSRPSLAGSILALLPLLALAPAAHADSIFDADPAQRGLLVTDLRLKHKALFQNPEANLEGGSLADATMSSGRLDAIKVGAPSTAGILAITVEPGEYRLATATAHLRMGNSMMNFRLWVPADSLPGINRRVAAGELVYVGRIEAQSIPRLTSQNEIHYSMAYDRERELQVWEKLRGKAKKSAWAEKIAARIAELQRAPAAVAASADSVRN